MSTVVSAHICVPVIFPSRPRPGAKLHQAACRMCACGGGRVCARVGLQWNIPVVSLGRPPPPVSCYLAKEPGDRDRGHCWLHVPAGPHRLPRPSGVHLLFFLQLLVSASGLYLLPIFSSLSPPRATKLFSRACDTYCSHPVRVTGHNS